MEKWWKDAHSLIISELAGQERWFGFGNVGKCCPLVDYQ
jgi:hypothetical protein